MGACRVSQFLCLVCLPRGGGEHYLLSLTHTHAYTYTCTHVCAHRQNSVLVNIMLPWRLAKGGYPSRVVQSAFLKLPGYRRGGGEQERKEGEKKREKTNYVSIGRVLYKSLKDRT